MAMVVGKKMGGSGKPGLALKGDRYGKTSGSGERAQGKELMKSKGMKRSSKS